jgi:hypothetical protein
MKFVQMISEGSICEKSNVFNKARYVFHVRREGLVRILAPEEDDCCKSLTFFVELDHPGSHIQVKNKNEGKSIDSVHNLLSQR